MPKNVSEKSLLYSLTQEIIDISKVLNIATKTHRNIQNMISTFIEEFRHLFMKMASSKLNKGPKYEERCSNFVEKLQWGMPGV